MNKMNWKNWKHITKIDPDKPLTKKVVDTIIQTQTDAIMISGTLGITKEKVMNIVDMFKGYDIPKVLEPANPQGMVYNRGIDFMFVPTVFNTKDSLFINGLHRAWVQKDKDKINWDIVVPEAYIILNPKCSAAKVTKAKPMSIDEAVAAAVSAEKFFKIPIVYVEYSGTYGDPKLVKAVSEALTDAHLIYGGGINTKERAQEMSKYATVVVGNTLYDSGTGSLVNTMKGTVMQEMKRLQEKLKMLKSIKAKPKV